MRKRNFLGALVASGFALALAAATPKMVIAQGGGGGDEGCLQHPVTLVCGDSWIDTCPHACD